MENNVREFPKRFKEPEDDGELRPRKIEHLNVEIACNGYVLEAIWDDGSIFKEVHTDFNEVVKAMTDCL